MAGNVREWCSDQKKAPDSDVMLAAAAGGSWRLSKPKYFASDYSTWKQDSADEEDLGFRVALNGG
jgi:formylglycine-generating enzyme required for sulfatase activity